MHDAPGFDHLLRTFAAVPVANRVLDLGCGPGGRTAALARLGFDLHACSTDRSAVAAARGNLAGILDPGEVVRRVVLVARLSALGYPDQYFDWIVAFDCFGGGAGGEAVPEVLAEARRVLKAGGWLYVVLPVQDAAGSRDAVAALEATMRAADFAPAGQPEVEEEAGRRFVRGIYRRVEAETPV